jgi:membrane protein YqaA with SNARE-associated domain
VDPDGKTCRMISLWILFSSSFLASTLLPGGSEALFLYTLSEALHPVWLIVIVATVGNTLGSMTNWLIGWLVARKRPLVRETDKKALARVERYGSPILLLAWLPVVGDPLCLAAGWAGVPLLRATFFISVGKLGRYLALYALW